MQANWALVRPLNDARWASGSRSTQFTSPASSVLFLVDSLAPCGLPQLLDPYDVSVLSCNCQLNTSQLNTVSFLQAPPHGTRLWVTSLSQLFHLLSMLQSLPPTDQRPSCVWSDGPSVDPACAPACHSCRIVLRTRCADKSLCRFFFSPQ